MTDNTEDPLAGLAAWVDGTRPPPPAPTSNGAGGGPRHLVPLAGGHGSTPYGEAALRDECEQVASTPAGGRNHQLNRSAVKLGGRVAQGELSEEVVIAALTQAAQQAGLGPAEIAKTIRSGLEYGKSRPVPKGELQPLAPEVRAWTPTVVPSSNGTSPSPATAPQNGQAPPPAGPAREPHHGELKWALRFAAQQTGRFIHSPGRGWLQWQGSHWAAVADAAPKRAVIRLLHQAFAEMPHLEPADRTALVKDINKCETNKGINGILGLASALEGIAVDDDALDNHPDLFACRNGTLNLLTDEFRPADPRDLITKVAGCDYQPDAVCPTYDTAMAVWQPDPDMRAYVHRIGGSALQGRPTEQTLPVWHGKGANGKGTTVEGAWLPVFGAYGQTLPVQVLLSRPGGSDFMPQKAEMAGARLIVTSEPDAGQRFSAATMKLLTGGDSIPARRLYRAPVMVRPTWQIVMLCNDLPEPPADDDAVWRRLRQVPWDVVVPEDQRDPHLPQRLAGELPGILNRLLAGWRDYRDHGGVRAPETVRNATAAWRADVDHLGSFLADETYQAPQLQERSARLYRAWVRWCKANGEDPGSQTAFSAAMKKKGYTKIRNNGAVWLGLQARDYEDDDSDPRPATAATRNPPA